jgi:hypothetical protein
MNVARGGRHDRAVIHPAFTDGFEAAVLPPAAEIVKRFPAAVEIPLPSSAVAPS